MSSQFAPDQIAALGLWIFVALSILAFSKKKFFQNDEGSSTSIRVQSIYLLAALLGLLLVRDEFAPIWGNMRFTYSLAYLYLSVANIAAIGLYVALIRTGAYYQKFPRVDAKIRIPRSFGKRDNGRKIELPVNREKGKEVDEEVDEEESLFQEAHKILNDM